MAKRSATFWLVGDVVDLFVQMGCVHHTAEQIVESSDGDCFGLSYLINPENNNFVPILDLAPDQFISKFEVESWERRLGITIPKPPLN